MYVYVNILILLCLQFIINLFIQKPTTLDAWKMIKLSSREKIGVEKQIITTLRGLR